MTTKITSVNQLAEFIALPEAVVLFGATWCNPCKQFRPHFDKASETIEDIPFGVVYMDEVEDASESELVVQYDVMSVPTVRLYNNGEATQLVERRIFPFLSEVQEKRR